LVVAEFERVAAHSPYLDTLGAAAAARLAAGVREVAFRRGSVLFLEGDQPGAVFLVRSGLVRLFVTELDGSETTVRIAGVGELVGELAIVDAGPRSASAIALRPVTAFRIPADRFAAELPEPGSVARNVMCGLVALVRENTRRLVIERSHRLESIVARLLGEDPSLLHSITQGELAGLLGVSRQSLNQILRAWERTGIVGRRDGRMDLVDPVGLQQRYSSGKPSPRHAAMPDRARQATVRRTTGNASIARATSLKPASRNMPSDPKYSARSGSASPWVSRG
jgi:CRP-like cAMP-binding protein